MLWLHSAMLMANISEEWQGATSGILIYPVKGEGQRLTVGLV